MGFLDFFRSKEYERKPKKIKESSPQRDQAMAERWQPGQLLESVYPSLMKIKEQAGFAFDNPDAGTEFDDKFFTPLEKAAPLDLSARRIHTAQRLSFLSYRRNPRAFRAIELVKNFVLGDGVRFRAKSKSVQKMLDMHWLENRWEIEAAERLRCLGVFGEQLYPVFIRETDGLVRLGSVSSLLIRGAIVDEDDGATVIKILTAMKSRADEPTVTIPEGIFDGRAFNVIRHDPETGKFIPTDGEGKDAFYFAENRITGQRRGLPDLLPSLDWLEGLDSFTFSMMERAAVSSNVVFDLKYKGLKDDEIQRRVDEFEERLTPGSTYGHNDNVELKIMTPDVGGSDAEIVSRILTKHIQAGTGLAGLFFGDAEDSASELTAPVAKMIQARQEFFKNELRMIFSYQIQMGKEKGSIPRSEDETFFVDLPRVFLRDLSSVTKSIVDLSEALITGVTQRWISDNEAAAVYRTSLEQLGTISDKAVALEQTGGNEDGQNAEEEGGEEGGGPTDRSGRGESASSDRGRSAFVDARGNRSQGNGSGSLDRG